MKITSTNAYEKEKRKNLQQMNMPIIPPHITSGMRLVSAELCNNSEALGDLLRQVRQRSKFPWMRSKVRLMRLDTYFLDTLNNAYLHWTGDLWGSRENISINICIVREIISSRWWQWRSSFLSFRVMNMLRGRSCSKGWLGSDASFGSSISSHGGRILKRINRCLGLLPTQT